MTGVEYHSAARIENFPTQVLRSNFRHSDAFINLRWQTDAGPSRILWGGGDNFTPGLGGHPKGMAGTDPADKLSGCLLLLIEVGLDHFLNEF